MLVMLGGISGVSKLAQEANGCCFDGCVESKVDAAGRWIVVGSIWSCVASELIERGESTVIIKDEDQSLADDKTNGIKSGDVVN